MTLTMDSPKLRALTRTQLQSLAKREFVRAVGKTEDIVRRLVQKHPRSVPVPEEPDNPSVSSAPPKQNVLDKFRMCTVSPIPETSGDGPDPKGKGKQVAEASLSPSSSIETLELLYPEDEPVAGPSNTKPETIPALYPEASEVSPGQTLDEDIDAHIDVPLPGIPNPGGQVGEEAEPDDVHDGVDYPKGAPNHYMVVDALRQFTTLVNAIPSMETRVAECRCLLQRTETVLEKVMPDARELTVTREYLETFLLAKMKQKRELWDGTARMEKKERKLRMAWLRAERRAESEKQWKETNELYEQHGLKPESLSAFTSQSDEEVIESLQTTPASSRSGGSKRMREESVDAESQSKRARA